MSSRRHGSLWAPSLQTICCKGVFLRAGVGGWMGEEGQRQPGKDNLTGTELRTELDFFRKIIIH